MDFITSFIPQCQNTFSLLLRRVKISIWALDSDKMMDDQYLFLPCKRKPSANAVSSYSLACSPNGLVSKCQHSDCFHESRDRHFILDDGRLLVLSIIAMGYCSRTCRLQSHGLVRSCPVDAFIIWLFWHHTCSEFCRDMAAFPDFPCGESWCQRSVLLLVMTAIMNWNHFAPDSTPIVHWPLWLPTSFALCFAAAVRVVFLPKEAVCDTSSNNEITDFDFTWMEANHWDMHTRLAG